MRPEGSFSSSPRSLVTFTNGEGTGSSGMARLRERARRGRSGTPRLARGAGRRKRRTSPDLIPGRRSDRMGGRARAEARGPGAFRDDRRRAQGDQAGRVPRGHAPGRRRGADRRRAHGADRGGARAWAAASPTSSTPRPAPRSSPTPAEIWARADLIVKVKEPLPAEWPLLRPRPDRLHLLPLRRRRAADAGRARQRDHGHRLRDDRATPRGSLPLLTPMSEVAGRMSIQEGAKYLERPQEGPRHPAGRRARASPRPTSRSWAAASSAPTPPRSPPASGPTSPSSTSTSTACATSTTSCRRTSPRSSATATPSASRSQRADLVIGAVLIPGAAGPAAGRAATT